jgi:predicted GNAT family acetyltransferase
MAHDFDNEPDAHRYTMRIDGDLVGVLDYAINGTVIAITRAYTQPPYRGHGYAADLVEYAVNDIEAAGTHRVVPSCWYVSDWFDAHPERAPLLRS